MENAKRKVLSKRLEEAKEEVRKREETVRNIEKSIDEIDQKDMKKVMKRYKKTPAEIEEILEAQSVKNAALLNDERSRKNESNKV